MSQVTVTFKSQRDKSQRPDMTYKDVTLRHGYGFMILIREATDTQEYHEWGVNTSEVDSYHVS